jgi:hypothetical protein
VHLSSHEEADDLGFRLGARAYPCKAKSAINFFLLEWRNICISVCLHASLTEVAVASFTEALLGLTGML